MMPAHLGIYRSENVNFLSRIRRTRYVDLTNDVHYHERKLLHSENRVRVKG